MRIAIAGAGGMVGSRLEHSGREAGHDIVRISRSTHVNVLDEVALTAALQGVDVVIDVLNRVAPEPQQSAAFFDRTSRALLAGEAAAGVTHHVVLSIVSADRVVSNSHYAGKRAQEAAVRAGPVPWTILRATQFFDLPAMVAGWTTRSGLAILAPLLVQPVDVRDVASALLETATAPPQHGVVELAGPETHDFVDMARRTLCARGDKTRLLAGWHDGPFTAEMAGDVLLPGLDARIGSRTFDDWLVAERL